MFLPTTLIQGSRKTKVNIRNISMSMSACNSTAQFNSIVHVASHMITALDRDDGERVCGKGTVVRDVGKQAVEGVGVGMGQVCERERILY